MSLNVVILAAGKGKRMHSKLPKVLHQLAGKLFIEHVIDTISLLKLKKKPIVIIGHQGDIIRQRCQGLNVLWVNQKKQLGTGHALSQALPYLDHGRVLVLNGDVPLVAIKTLKKLIKNTPHKKLGMVTAEVSDPKGYGRIVRNNKKQIIAIVEEKDATTKQRNIQEINCGIYLIPTLFLKKWLAKLTNNNAQKEFYLPDIIKSAVRENISIANIKPGSIEEIRDVNNCWQLAYLERFYQRKIAKKLTLQGVTLIDPDRVDIRGELTIGQDVIIDINVILAGLIKIGDHCTIGANTILRNVIIGNNVEIKPHSIIEGAHIANDCIVGPFAHIRPGTLLHPKSQIGNFVEIKKSSIHYGTKIKHLSYIGDSIIGKNVNIGAGTITCNYDGVNKYKTTIGDQVFIGAHTALIAPVKIGKNATIGAGSVITQNAPPDQLTLARAKQCSIKNWKRPKKIKKSSV